MRIALLDDYLKHGKQLDWSSIPDAVVDDFDDHTYDEAALVRQLQPYDVIVAMRDRTRFPASVIDKLPNLKLIVSTGHRNAAIDAEACARRGIVLCSALGAGQETTSEVAWALLLALAKRVAQADRAMRGGSWQIGTCTALVGKTLGLVGLGRLGKVTARYGQAFGMNVIAWSPNLTDERAAEQSVKRVSKQQLFAESDFISVHLVLSDSTRGVVGESELAAMKPTAYLVNTSRGGLLDEQALLSALRARRIAGAGLDVYWVEPLPAEHPLRSMDNVVMTPHHGFLLEENMRAFYANALTQIRNWIDGKPLTAFRSR